jgi:hypothetical protein
MADWSLRCTLLALANELRESMAGLRLRGSPPTRCAMFLNAASSAVAVCVCPVSVGLLEFPALVDLVILAGMAGRVRVRGWDSNPGPADYETSVHRSIDTAPYVPQHHELGCSAAAVWPRICHDQASEVLAAARSLRVGKVTGSFGMPGALERTEH